MAGCSFTGHRSIPYRHLEPLTALVRRAIDYAYRQGCRSFYSGGAVGFDTLCAREVISFRMFHSDVRLVMILPCKNQTKNWSSRQVAMYEYILSEADEIIYTGEEYTPDCMRIRNKRLADVCDILIAYAGRAGSGSSQTVKMAASAGKRVYNLYSAVENDN